MILDLSRAFFYDRINYSLVSNLFFLVIDSSMSINDLKSFDLSLCSRF